MSSGGALEAIQEFLRVPTPQAWIDAAQVRIAELLNDHANCEQKAAASALALMHRYPEQTSLCEAMSRLAREELRHFEQVVVLMSELGVARRFTRPSGYARKLRDGCRRQEPGRLVDSLVVGALIEARSCERFARLVPVLDEPIAGFYQRLLRSEARHFENYLALATELDDDLTDRIDALAMLEASLISAIDTDFAFHSGVPA